MGSREGRGGRRGLVDGLIETLRRALGRVTLLEIDTRIPEADVAALPPWPPAFVRPASVVPRASIEGGSACLEVAPVAPGDLELSTEAVCEPPPAESVSVWGPLPLGLTASVRDPDVALSPVAARTPTGDLALPPIEAVGASLGVPSPAVSAPQTRPQRVHAVARPLRTTSYVVADRELAAGLPVRRRALAHGKGLGGGLAAGMRALVGVSGLAPRDIRWEGFYGPMPDAEPVRMEVDAGSGCLLIWYARGAAAKATLTLAVGRRSQDGTLIAARFPQ